MFHVISPAANEPRPPADELSTMLAAMIIVPRPIGRARPSRAPSTPAPVTPSSAAPSAAANTAPTVTSESPAWTTPIRLLTPHSAFCAMDQMSMPPASTRPERRCGSRPEAGVPAPVAAEPPSRAVAGQTSRATSAIEANGSRWPLPRCGIVR